MRIDSQDLKRNPELAALIAQKLGEEATPRRPERRHAYRRRPTAVRQGGCASCAVPRIPTRADRQAQSMGIAFAYVAATVCAGLVYGWTHALRALLGTLAAAVPVWPGWWAAAALIGAWYVAKRVWGDLDAGGAASKLGRLLAGFAVLVAAMTVCFGLMGW